MTNDTIDQDARVTQTTIVRLLGYAAVRADLDAAHMRITRTVYLRAHIGVAEKYVCPSPH